MLLGSTERGRGSLDGDGSGRLGSSTNSQEIAGIARVAEDPNCCAVQRVLGERQEPANMSNLGSTTC